jgi:hypothetical protein
MQLPVKWRCVAHGASLLPPCGGTLMSSVLSKKVRVLMSFLLTRVSSLENRETN